MVALPVAPRVREHVHKQGGSIPGAPIGSLRMATSAGGTGDGQCPHLVHPQRVLATTSAPNEGAAA
jgi:hypothetical protein